MSLSNSLLMLPRELPSYLKVAYSLRYAEEPNTGNCITRICRIVKRIFSLIKELIYYRPFHVHFERNKEKLNTYFSTINQTLAQNQKPICVYFVSAYDNNGAVLGNNLYYYHHYKIQNLQKHFAVAAKLVVSQQEMKDFMRSIKRQYPAREIKFVDVVSHGCKSSLSIQAPGASEITAQQIHEDLFSDLAPDATILLDACSTGLGDKNIADEIARKTPGRTVLAPGPSMYFSKPIIRTKNKIPRVVSAVHGFAILNAYKCKSFSYQQRMPSQYPYVKDEALQDDILAIARFPPLQNSWLDRYIDENREDLKHRVIHIFNQLSNETKSLIKKEVWKNNDSPAQGADRFCETFLREHPLHISVRSSFRAVLNELINEVRDDPLVSKAKTLLYAQNVFQVISAFFRNICYQPAIAQIIVSA